jgi:NADPH:quinone reductase-like Zn-dependent oxidoreductase
VEQSGAGVDLVVEVGGVGTLPRSLRAIRMGGTIAQVGVLSGAGEALPLAVILHKQARIRGIYVGSRQDFLDMNKAIALTQMRPVGEDFPWTHAPQVFTRMEEGSHFGKLVMSVG